MFVLYQACNDFLSLKLLFVVIQVKTQQASEFCERVTTKRSVKSLETEIIQKTKRIQTEERKYAHFLKLVSWRAKYFFLHIFDANELNSCL